MGSWLHAATMVSTEGTVGHGWCTPFGCVTGDLLAQALLVLGLGALTFFALAALSFIPEARAAVREERSRASAERDAFERFARRVGQVEAGPARTSGPDVSPGMGTLAFAGGGGDDDRLSQAQRAYRETVMAVEHYDEEYGEPLPANVAAEFGDGVATAMVGSDVFTSALRETLVSNAEAARERRDSLCRALDCEEEALREAASTLRGVDQTVDAVQEGSTLRLSYGELMDRWRRLYEAEREVEGLLSDHQGELHGSYGVAPRLDGPVSLHEYLYDDASYTHPILAEGARVVERIEAAQDRTSLALSRRV